MPSFHLFFLDAAHRIERHQLFEAADEAEALRTVAPAVGFQPMELWCGSRRLRSFAADVVPAKAGEGAR